MSCQSKERCWVALHNPLALSHRAPRVQASLVRKRMLAERSTDAQQDSKSAEWCWGAVAAALCDAVLVGCLAAARFVIFHGASLRELSTAAVSTVRITTGAIIEAIASGRYPLGSCGAVAPALLIVAGLHSIKAQAPVSAAQLAAPKLSTRAQSGTWRARRQCTLVLLLIVGMAQLSSLACTNWAAAYAAAVVCATFAVAVCKLVR